MTTPATRQEPSALDATTRQWYAMRVTYRRELRVQAELKQLGCMAFVPMSTRFEKQGRRVVKIVEPAIHNLIFIFESQDFIQQFKNSHPELQYIMTRSDGTSHKTIVPEKQMTDFIAVCQQKDGNPQIQSSEELHLQPGQEVRITTGPLQGCIGTFQRVQGSRNRRFIISIPGGISVITTSITAPQTEAVK